MEWLVSLALIGCGLAAIFLSVRHNRYLVSYDEPGSVMFFLFGRTGLRVFWVIFGLALTIAGILVIARGIYNM